MNVICKVPVTEEMLTLAKSVAPNAASDNGGTEILIVLPPETATADVALIAKNLAKCFPGSPVKYGSI
jgi:hypothetical protein